MSTVLWILGGMAALMTVLLLWPTIRDWWDRLLESLDE